jgi:aspartyl-tRNA(Asn)/glutamyl-tRNA(Gln) amidotransferase subunit B
MYKSGKTPQAIIAEKGLVQITDEGALTKAIAEIIEKNPAQVEQYRGGRERVFGFFVGQVMKATQGKANPQLINDLLKKMLAG